VNLLHTPGGDVVLPELVLVGRADGGHLVVNPSRDVWERSELSPDELKSWSFLIAATGQAMLETLSQLDGGCINYWEAGNWSLNDAAEPRGPKNPRQQRRVHMHLLGRSPRATDPAWRWGEAPAFPDYKDRQKNYPPLTESECSAVVLRLTEILTQKYSAHLT
jgi:diadenosine tetraphosphate (Ap4A) HIT family hydrolase